MQVCFRFAALVGLTFSSIFSFLGETPDSALTCPTPFFNAGKSIPVDVTPLAIVSADFNNDGRRDFAVGVTGLAFGGSRVIIRLGDGGGNFADVDSIPVPSFATSLTTSDFNGDGFADLLVTHRWVPESNGISLLLGDGTGHFAGVDHIATVGEPYSAVAADFNGDDRMDFAIVDSLSLVQVFYGDNAGNFTGPLDITVGSQPLSIARGDFNNDGKVDLIAANNNSGFVSLVLANSTGGFNASVEIPIEATYNAGYVSVADINDDGNADAIVNSWKQEFGGTYYSGGSILIGNGSGGFVLQPLISFVGETDKIWLSDVNNDLKQDLIAGRGPAASIRLGQGDGTFGDEIPFTSARLFMLAVDDFNGDNLPDLLQSGSGFAAVQLFWGNGDGTFGASSVASGQRPNSISTTDINLDGRPDIVFSDYDASSVVVSTNNGNNSFSTVANILLSQQPRSVITPDLNNDAMADIAAITYEPDAFQAGKLAVSLNAGGGFTTPVMYSLGLGLPKRFLRALTTGDVTGDGIVDIVVASVDDRGWLLIAKGNGDGTFAFFSQIAVGTSQLSYVPWGVAAGDVNGDGINDLVATARSNLIVFLGTGAGNFAVPVFYPVTNTNSPVAEVALADLNHDGVLDAVVTNNGTNLPTSFVASLYILFGDGNGGFSSSTAYPADTGMASISVADMNADNNPDVVLTSGPRSASSDLRAAIFYGSSVGTFSSPDWYIAGVGAYDSAIADFNSDGMLDIITPNFLNGDISLLLSECRPPPPSTFPSLSIGADRSVQEPDTGTTEIQLTVTLSSASSSVVSVDYYTAIGSAKGSADYQTASGTLTFSPNETSKSFTIAVTGDTSDEFDENFHVYLANPLNVTISDRDVLITINDNDPEPLISINHIALIEGSNGQQIRSIPVTLSEASGKNISVHFATADGTATGGVDFIPSSGTLNITPGSAGNSVDVAIEGDTLVESDETLQIIIGDPVNAVLGQSTATVTLENDDIGGNVQLGNTIYDVQESGGLATITVTRAGGAASNIAVQYNTSDGTATAGMDYTPVSGSVTFGAGESTKSFTIPIINDSIDEDDVETVNVTISGVTGGATLGTPSAATLNIHDDDTASTAFDYDGDGRSDISVFRPSSGAWYLQRSTAGYFGGGFGAAGDKIVPADYDGDDKTDIAVYRPSTGIWYVSNSANGAITYTVFGIAEDLPTPADYDGDGKADISVFRPSTGTWYRINSSDGSFTAAQFGADGDTPTIGDFDADGKADIAVFRPSTGAWYQTWSSNGFLFGEQFGIGSDRITPADYDGDGKTDIAIYRPSEGLWYVKNSATTTYVPYVFGLAEDIPVPADFDGDGKSDIGVFRPSDGTWYIVNSSNSSYTIFQFGQNGDTPTQSAFGN